MAEASREFALRAPFNVDDPVLEVAIAVEFVPQLFKKFDEPLLRFTDQSDGIGEDRALVRIARRPSLAFRSAGSSGVCGVRGGAALAWLGDWAARFGAVQAGGLNLSFGSHSYATL